MVYSIKLNEEIRRMQLTHAQESAALTIDLCENYKSIDQLNKLIHRAETLQLLLCDLHTQLLETRRQLISDQDLFKVNPEEFYRQEAEYEKLAGRS